MKQPHKSLGFWGVVVAAAITAAEGQGVLPGGTATTLAEFAALVVALYGRWRATEPLSVTGS